MLTNGASLAAAFDSRDLERLIGLLDEQVTWRGLPNPDHDHDAASEHERDDDHDHAVPLCSDRDQVRESSRASWRGAAPATRS
jgi:hypothetical protein